MSVPHQPSPRTTFSSGLAPLFASILRGGAYLCDLIFFIRFWWDRQPIRGELQSYALAEIGSRDKVDRLFPHHDPATSVRQI